MITEAKREYLKKWREDHKDYIRIKNKEWRESNRDRVHISLKEWKANNPERVRELRKRDYHNHHEERIHAAKLYHQNHPEIVRKSISAYKAKYPERIKSARKKYSVSHPEKMRAKWAKNSAKRKLRIGATSDGTADKFYDYVHNSNFLKCYYCNETLSYENVNVDHIIPLARGGSHIDSNLCIACDSCNSKKSSKLPSEFKLKPQMLFNL